MFASLQQNGRFLVAVAILLIDLFMSDLLQLQPYSQEAVVVAVCGWCLYSLFESVCVWMISAQVTSRKNDRICGR